MRLVAIEGRHALRNPEEVVARHAATHRAWADEGIKPRVNERVARDIEEALPVLKAKTPEFKRRTARVRRLSHKGERDAINRGQITRDQAEDRKASMARVYASPALAGGEHFALAPPGSFYFPKNQETAWPARFSRQRSTTSASSPTRASNGRSTRTGHKRGNVRLGRGQVGHGPPDEQRLTAKKRQRDDAGLSAHSSSRSSPLSARCRSKKLTPPSKPGRSAAPTACSSALSSVSENGDCARSCSVRQILAGVNPLGATAPAYALKRSGVNLGPLGDLLGKPSKTFPDTGLGPALGPWLAGGLFPRQADKGYLAKASAEAASPKERLSEIGKRQTTHIQNLVRKGVLDRKDAPDLRHVLDL